MSGKTTRTNRQLWRACAVALCALGASNAHSQDSDWKLELTPYIWGMGIDADVTVGSQTVTVDKSFSDVLDSVDIAANFLTVAQYRRFVMWGQVDFLSASTDELDNPPARGSLDSDSLIGTFAVGYQFGGGTKRSALDVLIGVRHLAMENELKLDGIGTFKRDKDFTDPVIILRPSFRISDRWRFNPTFSYGSGGDSEKTYELQPQLQFQINDWVALRFGYRKLYYEIDADNGNKWDGAFQGLIVGIGGTFGNRRESVAAVEPPPAAPVAAVAPPAPVAPPPPPRDTDGDTVADASDQCPNTERGARIDAIGCAYDLRLSAYFDYNSATLKPESAADLDRAVDLLKRVPTMTGVIEGHTDSIGSNAFNQSLSAQRARAVLAYLTEHGVPASRLRAVGLGKTQPIADNETDAGRAQNRRVVLHRTDQTTQPTVLTSSDR